MKNTINTILIFVGIVIVLSFISDLIGRAFIYSIQVDTDKMNICLSNGVDFKSCYRGVYSSYTKFDEIK